MLGRNYFLKTTFMMGAVMPLLLSNVAVAKTENISIELRDGGNISGVKPIEKKQSSDDLSILDLIVGSSKLSDVKEKMGNEIYHEGDAGMSLYVLCYEGADGSIVAFESGEMGGSDHTVTAVSMFGPKAHYRLKKVCIKSAKVNSGLDIGGVRLGMSKASIKKLRGEPSKELPKLLLYEYHLVEGSSKGKADISSRSEIGFIGNKVSYFSISKIESY